MQKEVEILKHFLCIQIQRLALTLLLEIYNSMQNNFLITNVYFEIIQLMTLSIYL